VAYGYLVHGVHHAYPDDSRRWVLPLVATVPIAIVLFCIFTLALGRFAAPAFAGFMHGYLAYDLLHYVIHRGRVPTRLGRYLRQYHLAHHYATPDRHFGVSSPLWDVVFRTR
jgi:sterol desaturase/sphingolipid hydroxylase (fatty acid hydroxylase superfamily)